MVYTEELLHHTDCSLWEMVRMVGIWQVTRSSLVGRTHMDTIASTGGDMCECRMQGEEHGGEQQVSHGVI